MSNVYQGQLVVHDQRFAVVCARFNEFITSKLLGGAVDMLKRHGCAEDHIDTVWVPGAFEIPMAAKAVAETHQYDAVICTGCVIRGQTPHFDYVAGEVAKGVARVGLEARIPVTFGVITADTLEQAIERAGSKAGNKGADAAAAAIEMVNLFAEIAKQSKRASAPPSGPAKSSVAGRGK